VGEECEVTMVAAVGIGAIMGPMTESPARVIVA
jgi:hypothetical protein